jgi:hypothetical protein
MWESCASAIFAIIYMLQSCASTICKFLHAAKLRLRHLQMYHAAKLGIRHFCNNLHAAKLRLHHLQMYKCGKAAHPPFLQ